MRYLVLVAMVFVVGLVFASPTEAACSSLPSDGYELPGIMLRVEHGASGECFNVWLDHPAEIVSYLDHSGMSNPKLIVTASSENYNSHNPSYGWHAEFARFEDGVSGDNIKPSDLNAGLVSVMDVTIEDVVDNRVREWAQWAGITNKVDVADIIKVTTAWNKSYDESGFKPNQDVYPDGYIDILDVYQVVEAWGSTTYSLFHEASSYTPTSCSSYHVATAAVTFQNASGGELTFWTESKYGDQWYKDNYVKVPNSVGGNIADHDLDPPDKVRLMVASLTSETLNSISWSTECNYGPPNIVDNGVDPIPFNSADISEAQSAGTYYSVSQGSEPYFITQATLDSLGMTLAEVESETGEDWKIISEASLTTNQSLLIDIPFFYGLQSYGLVFYDPTPGNPNDDIGGGRATSIMVTIVPLGHITSAWLIQKSNPTLPWLINHDTTNPQVTVFTKAQAEGVIPWGGESCNLATFVVTGQPAFQDEYCRDHDVNNPWP